MRAIMGLLLLGVCAVSIWAEIFDTATQEAVWPDDFVIDKYGRVDAWDSYSDNTGVVYHFIIGGAAATAKTERVYVGSKDVVYVKNFITDATFTPTFVGSASATITILSTPWKLDEEAGGDPSVFGTLPVSTYSTIPADATATFTTCGDRIYNVRGASYLQFSMESIQGATQHLLVRVQ